MDWIHDVKLTSSLTPAEEYPLMTYRKEVFVEQVRLIDCFARHLVHHRTIKANLASDRPPSWFWSDTCDAHLLQASIYWCMVFGSHGANETHLRHLVVEQADELQRSFRERLLAVLRITESEWRSYRDEVLAFRNKYAAHRALGPKPPVPTFDRALETAFCYDEWVREVIYPDLLDGPPLRKLVNEWRRSVGSEVLAALDGSTLR